MKINIEMVKHFCFVRSMQVFYDIQLLILEFLVNCKLPVCRLQFAYDLWKLSVYFTWIHCQECKGNHIKSFFEWLLYWLKWTGENVRHLLSKSINRKFQKFLPLQTRTASLLTAISVDLAKIVNIDSVFRESKRIVHKLCDIHPKESQTHAHIRNAYVSINQPPSINGLHRDSHVFVCHSMQTPNPFANMQASDFGIVIRLL